jgi:aryl-alcohol dehydrogenase-like predicted oxidoreductase
LLKYLLANPDVDTLLPATSRLERVQENTAIADEPTLPQEVLRRLEAMMR